MVYWQDGEDRRILFSAGSKLYALRAESGELIHSFGSDGTVDLRDGLGRDASDLFVASNTPGVVFQDLLILGTRVSEALPAAPGHIRAYNVRTGKLVWIFHTIPQPGEYGHDSWPPEAWKWAGGANAWAGLSLDPERELVFASTGSAAYDFYGANRTGANLFANCVLALDATSGQRVWHFQIVHHDLWDRDLPAPPNLVTLEREGKRVDAVAQVTKSAHLFLFDRQTGKPLFPVEERPVPSSDLPGEKTSETQPFPTRPFPFARQAITAEDATNLSAGAHTSVVERLKRMRTGRPFIPPSREGSILVPGFDGGAEWGGAAFDPHTEILYVNSNDTPWFITMIEAARGDPGPRHFGEKVYAQHCIFCHGVDRQGDALQVYPSLLELDKRLSRQQTSQVIVRGKGAMPSYRHLSDEHLNALLSYLLDAARENDQARTRDSSEQDSVVEYPETATSSAYVFTGYHRLLDPEGYPGTTPPWGTLNAIDLNQGEFV